MGAFDKAKDKAEQLVGQGKEGAGQAIDNEETAPALARSTTS